ncbi:MAG: hypothetical protein U1E17_09020 [Geminicoccaceae bacterium]
MPEQLFAKIEQFFATVGWRVVAVKYGKKLQSGLRPARQRGPAHWIDACPNDLYAALCFGAGPRGAPIESDLGHQPGGRALLEPRRHGTRGAR